MNILRRGHERGDARLIDDERRLPRRTPGSGFGR